MAARQTRYQAQLALSSPTVFPAATRPTAVKERCTLTNRGRGVLPKVGLARVRPLEYHFYVL